MPAGFWFLAAVGMAFVAATLFAFVWAIQSGQYEDEAGARHSSGPHQTPG